MTFNYSRTVKLQKLLTIVGSWLIVAVLITAYDHAMLNSENVASLSDRYGFVPSLIINTSASLFGSVLGGLFLIYYVNERMRNQKYGMTILAVVVSFLVLVSCIILIIGITYVPYVSDTKLFTKAWEMEFKAHVLSTLHLKNVIVWSIVVGFTQLFLHINDKFGHGILWQFIKGKYHSPVQENRVFMFLDIRSSTSIAEKLGNEAYYNLLRDFYSDITAAIVSNKGSIYQYVGDEVVVSWRLKDGIQDNHCINCFLDMRQKIASLSDRYRLKYGLVPEFKAGLHYGTVTAGEIGVLKRDITFSGDVLNTASRIQEQCNHYGVNILVAKDLVDILPNSEDLVYKAIGEIKLRGKNNSLALFTLADRNVA